VAAEEVPGTTRCEKRGIIGAPLRRLPQLTPRSCFILIKGVVPKISGLAARRTLSRPHTRPARPERLDALLPAYH
jgi:hypothetical protein